MLMRIWKRIETGDEGGFHNTDCVDILFTRPIPKRSIDDCNRIEFFFSDNSCTFIYFCLVASLLLCSREDSPQSNEVQSDQSYGRKIKLRLTDQSSSSVWWCDVGGKQTHWFAETKVTNVSYWSERLRAWRQICKWPKNKSWNDMTSLSLDYVKFLNACQHVRPCVLEMNHYFSFQLICSNHWGIGSLSRKRYCTVWCYLGFEELGSSTDRSWL